MSRYVTSVAAGAANRPVAVMFGWLGAQDKFLRRYADLYHSLGVTTVLRTTVPAPVVFGVSRKETLVHVADELLRTLNESHAHSPVVLTYFSNGGCFVHEQVIKLLAAEAALAPAARRYANVAIAGCVFDSCPAWLSPTAGAAAVSEGIRNPVLKAVVSQLARVAFATIIQWWWGADRAQRYFAALAADPIPAPALYVYSNRDVVTRHDRLTDFIADRRARGHAIHAWFIDDVVSPHVAHYIKQPDKYRATLAGFLKACGIEATSASPPLPAASAV